MTRSACVHFIGVAAMLIGAACCSPPATAHEVRPTYLQITESSDHHCEVLWKQPSLGSAVLHLVPHIQGGLLDTAPDSVQMTAEFQIRRWHRVPTGPQGLAGREIRVEGLEQTITDTLVSITGADGARQQQVLTPRQPVMVMKAGAVGLAVPAYLRLGVEHILTGADHLAFVLCLLLLVGWGMMLVKTITAFTVAHSVTLAGSALGLISIRPALIEALVALSIVFVAVELLHSRRGRPGLTARAPWLIALLFGLLHGCAFAGALAQIGLPADAIPASLLMFNVGVEIGQLLFIAAALGIGWLLSRWSAMLLTRVSALAPVVIGSLAAFWFIGRVQSILG